MEELVQLAGTHHAAGNNLRVIVVHHKRSGDMTGCGALGHLNPHHAEHGVESMFTGLSAHGVNPEAYFGMSQTALVSAVKGLALEEHADVRARRLLDEAAKQGLPVIAATFGHEDGSLRVIGTANLSAQSLRGSYSVSSCSDARVSTKVGERVRGAVADAIDHGRDPDSVALNLSELVVPHAEVQAPSRAIVHGPGNIRVSKHDGQEFHVSCAGEPDALALASLAYAIASFGPESKGPKSLARIEFSGVTPATKAAFKKRLAGLRGVQLG